MLSQLFAVPEYPGLVMTTIWFPCIHGRTSRLQHVLVDKIINSKTQYIEEIEEE